MPKYTAPAKIVALASGPDPSLLWVACEDNSIYRLTKAANPPDTLTPDRDPSLQWIWEKIPSLP